MCKSCTGHNYASKVILSVCSFLSMLVSSVLLAHPPALCTLFYYLLSAPHLSSVLARLGTFVSRVSVTVTGANNPKNPANSTYSQVLCHKCGTGKDGAPKNEWSAAGDAAKPDNFRQVMEWF
jgi:hypothetical protein